MLYLIFLSFTQVTASVLGIDFGSELIKCSLIRPGKKLVIVENEQSKRSTPSAISFSEQGREYGYNALKNQPKRPESTLLYIHNLLGGQEIDYFNRTFQPIPLSKNSDRGSILLKIGEDFYETEEITAMILEFVREMAEKFGEGAVKDCSITVPSFWTRAQKIALISAANAAGLNVLSLINENTGAAFYYGIDRLDNVTDHFALFYNLGASYLQVTLAKYGAVKKAGKQMENVEILAHGFDKELGGSLFDYLIAGLLAQKFKEKHGVDLKEHPKSMVRVLAQANQAKKTLSANKNTLVLLNSIYKGIDFSYTLTRDEFDKLLEPYFDRLVDPVLSVIKQAGLEVSSIHSLEIVGGVSRIPKVQEILKQKTGIEISTHLNGDESMAHGAAIFAANFSSVVQVKPMWLSDIGITTYSAKLSAEDGWAKETVLFKEGAKLGNRKKIMFSYNQDLVVVIQETRDGKSSQICKYELKGISELERDEVSIFLSFVLDNSGIPFLHTADARYDRVVKKREDGGSDEGKLNLYGDDEKNENKEQGSDDDKNSEDQAEQDSEVKEKPPTEGEKNSEDQTKTESESEKTEEVKQDDKSEQDKSEEDEQVDQAKTEDKTTQKNEENTQNEDEKTEEKAKTPENTSQKDEDSASKKQRTVKLNFKEIQLESPTLLTDKDVSKIIKRLESQKEAEVLAKKLIEAQNDLETSIYSLSEKLEEEKFIRVTSAEERGKLLDEISSLREWMEGDAFKESSAYEVKKRKRELDSLFSDPIQREKEHEIRESAVEKAYKELGRLEDALVSLNKTKPWIPTADLLLAWSRLNDTLKWLEGKVLEQKTLKEWEPLAFKTSELEVKVSSVQKYVEKLKKLQKPKPKKGAGPDFINFGDNFDKSKIKMENVKVDGKDFSFDSDAEEEKTPDVEEKEDL